MNPHRPCRSSARFLSAVALAGAALPTVAQEAPPEPAPELPTSAVSFAGLLPRPVTSFGATVESGWLYVLGGFFGTPHEYNQSEQSSSFARMNLADGSWEDLPSPGKMQSVALVAHEGGLYRVGGMVARNQPGEPQSLASIADVGRFDPMTRTWSELPPLPEGRSSHMAAVLDGAIFVVGGWTLAPEAETLWRDDVLRLDLGGDGSPSDAWERIDAPFQRRALAVCASAGRLIAIGGMSPDGELSSEVDVYDPVAGSWSKGPSYPGGAFGASATSIGGDVYASGGDGTLFRWRIGEDRWHPVTSLVFPRFFHQLVRSGESELLAVGGVARGGRIRHVEAVDLAPAQPRVEVTVWTLPAPGSAKNRQGALLRDNSLYLFGGNRSLGQHDFEPEHFVDEAFELDLASLSWSPMEPLPVRRQSLQAAFDAGRRVGFAIGGFGHDGEVARTYAEAFRYDPRYDTWSALPARLPEPRSQFGLVEHDGALWLFGGLDYDPTREEGEHFVHPLEVLRFEPGAEGEEAFERTGIELPRPRRAFGAAVLGGRCYLVGGLREGFEAVAACDVFDFATRSFSQVAAPRHARISPELAALDGKLFLAGGSSDRGDGFEPDRSLEVFDPATGAWSVVLEELPLEGRHLRMFPFGARLLLYSAQSEEPLVRVALVDLGSSSLGTRDVAFHALR